MIRGSQAKQHGVMLVYLWLWDAV